MKLISVQVQNFRSIEDSGEFEIGDLTCLVGKNEAGKTAILHALHGLNSTSGYTYDKTRDYPRRYLNKYDEHHPDGRSKVVNTRWILDEKDMAQVSGKFGAGVLCSAEVGISFGIGYSTRMWDVQVDEIAFIRHCVKKHHFDDTEHELLMKVSSVKGAVDFLTQLEQPAQQALLDELRTRMGESSVRAGVIEAIEIRLPKFFYTSHFERMAGDIALNQLAQDKQQGNVKSEDKIFLDFLEYAGTTVEELRDTKRYEELKAKCEGASNDITDEIFEFWSQNDALEIKIELSEGKVGDTPPFNVGTVARIRIENKNHRVTVPLSERSAGFVWFFSFLAQFKQLKKITGNAIILLDEPGLTLHGKAQADLLRYIQERLLPTHQVIYTTHSPFMVPAERMADVRVVEDVIEYERGGRRPIVKGTKVTADVLSVDKDTLFPLQGHLGYEITQSLFIGKNTLLVEGPSDVLYIQAVSQALLNRGREGLDRRWTVCPTGGIDKVQSFASLFGGNKLNVAVLCDYGNNDKKKVENLRRNQILKTEQVFTTSDFTNKSESDVEDLFHPAIYAEIVNAAFKLNDDIKLTADVFTKESRMVKLTEDKFKVMPPSAPEFNHFTPSDWLIRNPQILDDDKVGVNETLDSFEKVFEQFNKLLAN